MADQIIEIPGVGPVAFPDSMDDAAITAAADRLYRDANPKPMHSSASLAPAVVGLARAARPAVERAALEVATHPRITPMVGKLASGIKTLGDNATLTGSLIGGPKGAAIGRGVEMAAPIVAKGVEASPGFVAKIAGSRVAQAATGPAGLVASMPFTESGDRPVGETAETTAARQAEFEAEYAKLQRDAAERKRTGQMTTSDYIRAAIEMVRRNRRAK